MIIYHPLSLWNYRLSLFHQIWVIRLGKWSYLLLFKQKDGPQDTPRAVFAVVEDRSWPSSKQDRGKLDDKNMLASLALWCYRDELRSQAQSWMSLRCLRSKTEANLVTKTRLRSASFVVKRNLGRQKCGLNKRRGCAADKSLSCGVWRQCVGGWWQQQH